MSWEELAAQHPWPGARPPAPACGLHGWFGGREGLLAAVLPAGRLTVVEVGSWYGASAAYFLGLDPANRLVAVDTWAGSPAIAALPAAAALVRDSYAGFLHNLWPHRARVIPVRADGLDGLAACRRADVVPDVIYLDADHDYVPTAALTAAAARLFPGATVCGDDYDWPSVRTAVEHAAGALSRAVRAAGCVWALV